MNPRRRLMFKNKNRLKATQVSDPDTRDPDTVPAEAKKIEEPPPPKAVKKEVSVPRVKKTRTNQASKKRTTDKKNSYFLSDSNHIVEICVF